MFLQQPTLEQLQTQFGTYLVGLMGIEFTEVGPDYLVARMPVDERTFQAFRIMHGGASVVLAETLGSIAANYCVDFEKYYCVGLDINANHLRSMRSGWVYAKASPIHLGRSTQVWGINITDENGKPVCISRLTMAVMAREISGEGKQVNI
jgi:1,4-dihydroxy-2-naphthoyl-CoA hydrolase